jgi:Uma2 family endonuclease
MATARAATIEDLYRVEEKAEIVGGEIVVMSPGGGRHGRVAGHILFSLLAWERHTCSGFAYPDNVGFLVDLPHRWSFSPDVAFCTKTPTDAFVDGAPQFAVEVRSPEDYGAAAERAMSAKRADYFAAGTLVVWDVDVRGEVVRVFRAANPESPDIRGRGQIADAEPAVPGWSVPVDEVFAS